jgi:tetratricopeptide (TPR) repeat protein
MRTKIQILAISGLVTFLSTNPVNAQKNIGAFTKSYEYEYAANYKKASETLVNVYDENSYELNLRLGWLQYQAADYTKSISYYKKAIINKPTSIEARIGLSYPLAALGNDDDIIANYQEVLKIDADHSTANYWLGYIYYMHKDMDLAAKHTKKVLEFYPFDYDSNFLLGKIYIAQGKITEAKEVLGLALYYNPSSIMVKEVLEKL